MQGQTAEGVDGSGRGGPFARIMTAVARKLTDEQIRAVSLYYASLREGRRDDHAMPGAMPGAGPDVPVGQARGEGR